MGSNPVQDFLHDGFSKIICPKKNFREFTMQISFGSVRTLRNDSLMTLVSPQIAIWRVFKYLSAEYRRKLSDDISTKCWAILGPYSVSKSTDSRPTLVRQVIQVGRPLVDTLSVCRSTLDRNLDRYVAFNSRSISVECRWVVHHCTVSGIISH